VRTNGWLLTLGGRVDGWQTSNGHLVESTVATGAITKALFYPRRSGRLPTARAGARYDFSDSFYLRAAAYEGFRAPSLNELYRPFRVGLITTLANPALTPEELYGTEIGVGGLFHGTTWQATVFYNQIHDAIANVTVGTNLQQRENAGDINAYGVEFDAAYPVTDWAALTASFDDVNASLNGNQPQQAPRWTATGGLDLKPLPRLTVDAFVRYEGRRFSDDVNTAALALNAATTFDARISYLLTDNLSAYVYGDNLLNARVGSTAAFQPLTNGTTGVVVNYAAPRIIGGGLSFAQ
jgi:outer membrane receptor protein involved in Fe transport